MESFINESKSKRKASPFASVALVCAALLLTVFGAGCNGTGGGGSSSSGGEVGARAKGKYRDNGKIVVGFSQMEHDGPWRIAESESLKSEAAKRSNRFQLKVTDARGQTSQQVSDVEDLIAQGVDVLFLAPREAKGFDTALQQAREAGIPVFLIDREVNGTPGKDYITFIGSDFVKEGQRAAEWLATKTNGKAGIVELRGTAGSSVANDRHNGFAEELKKHPEMRIIADQDAGFTRAKGLSVMQNIIQSKGSEITAVYTHNDEMALGAIEALKAAGRKPGVDVIVLSVDGQKSALESIIRGELGATVECNPRFGPIAFDVLEKFLRGEQVPTKIINEDRFFESSNAQQFVAEAF